MEIVINGRRMNSWLRVAIDNRYDAICSTFSVDFYFDPESSADRLTFRPGAYHSITISHKGVLLLTGYVTKHGFASAGDPPKQVATLSGYSKTGVLQDCQYGSQQSPLGGGFTQANQFFNVDIRTVAEQVCNAFGLKAIVDREVLDDDRAMAEYTQPKIGIEETAADFLISLCRQKNINLWCNEKGQLVLSKPKVGDIVTTERTYVRENVLSGKVDYYNDPGDVYPTATVSTKSRPVMFNFVAGTWTKMHMDFDLRGMHYQIQVVTNQDQYDETTRNPYVGYGYVGHGDISKAYQQLRFRRVKQTASSDDVNETDITARAVLGDELKGFAVNIHVDRWILDGHMITPNQMVTIKNPECYIFKETKFFIQSVTYSMDNVSETAILTCVLPDCFLSTPVKNIFG